MNPPTTQDPALTKPTFSNNCTLTAALQRIAARHSTNPAPVISGAETDGTDASPEPPTIDPLRTALELIATKDYRGTGMPAVSIVMDMREIARRALEAK